MKHSISAINQFFIKQVTIFSSVLFNAVLIQFNDYSILFNNKKLM